MGLINKEGIPNEDKRKLLWVATNLSNSNLGIVNYAWEIGFFQVFTPYFKITDPTVELEAVMLIGGIITTSDHNLLTKMFEERFIDHLFPYLNKSG